MRNPSDSDGTGNRICVRLGEERFSVLEQSVEAGEFSNWSEAVRAAIDRLAGDV